MTVIQDTGHHLPNDPERFVFDDEVAAIFDNMAVRSIVGYERAFKIVGYLSQRLDLPAYTQIWDMGTSTGKGLRAIRDGVGLHPYLDYRGCDLSEPMVERARQNCPWAQFEQWDFLDGLPSTVEQGNVGMLVWAYTLQFLESRELREQLIRDSFAALRPGGCLVILEKYHLHDDLLRGVMQDAYIQFRRENGYSLQEIRAKSEALKNSMWPTEPDFASTILVDAGAKVDILYRDLNFGGIVAFKETAV